MVKFKEDLLKKAGLYELEALDVPEKYQPYKDISIEIKSDGIPIFACILGMITVLMWVIAMVIMIWVS